MVNDRMAQPQALLVQLPFTVGHSSDHEPALDRLVAALAEAVTAGGAGEFDGDEVGEGSTTLFFYGPNADELFEAIEPLLVKRRTARGTRIIKRYGPPGAPEHVVML